MPKKTKGVSPTKNSLKLLRKLGYMVAVTEHWNQFARIRQDLFGFADLLAVDVDNKRTIAVQTTSAANFSARRKKITENENAAAWLAAGNSIVIHGWKKNKSNRWECREETLTIEEVA